MTERKKRKRSSDLVLDEAEGSRQTGAPKHPRPSSADLVIDIAAPSGAAQQPSSPAPISRPPPVVLPPLSAEDAERFAAGKLSFLAFIGLDRGSAQGLKPEEIRRRLQIRRVLVEEARDASLRNTFKDPAFRKRLEELTGVVEGPDPAGALVRQAEEETRRAHLEKLWDLTKRFCGDAELDPLEHRNLTMFASELGLSQADV